MGDTHAAESLPMMRSNDAIHESNEGSLIIRQVPEMVPGYYSIIACIAPHRDVTHHKADIVIDTGATDHNLT